MSLIALMGFLSKGWAGKIGVWIQAKVHGGSDAQAQAQGSGQGLHGQT